MKWLATKALIVIIICTLVWIVFPKLWFFGTLIIPAAWIMWLEFKNSI